MDNNQFKLLIVEDEAVMLNTLSARFRQEKYDVLEANNGAKGLSMALQEHPDLILLDIVMPDMDGLEMLKKLREDGWGKDAKVIILTNVTELDRLADALTSGSYDYLLKTDWELDDIVKKVKAKLALSATVNT